MALGMVLGVSSLAFAQAADTPYQVHFAAKIRKKDVVNLSNSGASSTVASPPNGALCANLYTMSTAGQMLGCCACVVPANNLVSVPIASDLLEGVKAKSAVIKMMTTIAVGGTTCNPASVGTGAFVLATGMLPWKDDLAFTPSTLSAAELTSLTARCGFLHATPNIC